MEYMEFKKQLVEELKKAFPHCTIDEVAEDKIAIKEEGKDVAPVLRVDEIYQKDKEIDEDKIAAIVHLLNKAIEDAPKIDRERISSWEHMKDLLFIRLLPTERVQEEIIRFPLTESVSCVISIEIENGGIININKELCDAWGKTKVEVIETAKHNRDERYTGIIEDVTSRLLKIGQEQELDEDIDLFIKIANEREAEDRQFIVSNSRGILGAGCIIQPETQSELEKIFGGRFIIMPSSVHEVIVSKYSEDDIEDIREMIREVNHDMQNPRDFLCDNPMIYENGAIREV